MSRELIEFSNLIDEQFEPDNTGSDELWLTIQSWFDPQSAKELQVSPLQGRALEENFTRRAS
ncbi:hypothetical protein ACFQ3S_14075 [Mucilaginibacter terrae]|uniref:hypothetical protein n=1 Tax=Mucilaginibacter terrae TaxID=1955052 RepID=UPI003637E1F4